MSNKQETNSYIQSYIHFLSELTPGNVNLAEAAQYVKGKHSIALLKLRFDPIMLSHIRDPSSKIANHLVKQNMLGFLDMLSKRESKKTGRLSHLR